MVTPSPFFSALIFGSALLLGGIFFLKYFSWEPYNKARKTAFLTSLFIMVANIIANPTFRNEIIEITYLVATSLFSSVVIVEIIARKTNFKPKIYFASIGSIWVIFSAIKIAGVIVK